MILTYRKKGKMGAMNEWRKRQNDSASEKWVNPQDTKIEYVGIFIQNFTIILFSFLSINSNFKENCFSLLLLPPKSKLNYFQVVLFIFININRSELSFQL